MEKTLKKAETLRDKGDFNGALYTALMAVDMKINDVGFKFKINQSPYVILDMIQIHPYTRNDYWLLVNSSKSMYKSELDANRGIVTARYIIKELETVEKKLYATLPQRIGAFAIDLAIIFGILLGFFAIGAFLRLYDLTDIFAPETMIWLVAFILWLWIAQAIYFTILEGLNGQTIGKKVLRIKVTTDEMTKCGFMGAFTRNVIRLLDTVLLLYTVSILIMVIYPRKQRIGDKVAKTIVLKV